MLVVSNGQSNHTLQHRKPNPHVSGKLYKSKKTKLFPPGAHHLRQQHRCLPQTGQPMIPKTKIENHEHILSLTTLSINHDLTKDDVRIFLYVKKGGGNQVFYLFKSVQRTYGYTTNRQFASQILKEIPNHTSAQLWQAMRGETAVSQHDKLWRTLVRVVGFNNTHVDVVVPGFDATMVLGLPFEELPTDVVERIKRGGNIHFHAMVNIGTDNIFRLRFENWELE